jgi:hypothetical protein
MTMSVNQLFIAVEGKNYVQLWTLMQSMNLEQLTNSATAIGPDRLRELLYRFVRQSMFNPQAAFTQISTAQNLAPKPTQVIPEVLAQAFGDKSFLQTDSDKSIKAEVAQQLKRIHAQRAAKPQIVLYRDITHTIDLPNMCPAPLSDSDFEAAATRHSITVAAIKAVSFVESGGRSGFDERSRAKILFEAHKFREHTKRLFDISHPHLSCVRSSAKKYYSWDQYNRLYEAMVLNPVAAIKACSWGKFQVLGSNHNGWPDPVSFARAMQQSEVNQLKSFEAYCVTNNLIKHLKNKEWASFARGYNGANYSEYAYDTKIEAAYKKYGGK